jgi:hypothetical protein
MAKLGVERFMVGQESFSRERSPGMDCNTSCHCNLRANLS